MKPVCLEGGETGQMSLKKQVLFILILLMIVNLAACTFYDFDELQRFKLVIEKLGNGTVTVSPEKSYYQKGDKVTLTAIAAEGWEFVTWSGNLNSTESPVTIVLENSSPIIATFTNPNVSYTLQVNYSGHGTVKIEPEQESYLTGSTVTLTAEPGPGSVFSHWDGAITGNTNPATIVMDNTKAVTAVFLTEGATGIVFADANLEAIVRNAINKPSGPITVEDVQNLTSLDASTKLITSLQGIEYLTSLTSLNLSTTTLSNINELASLVNLEYLNLSNNEINDISVISNLIHLQELYLNNNQISDIADLLWFWYKDLTILDLSDNNLNDISTLAGLISLERLRLNNNQISNLKPLSNLINLTELSLNKNQISEIFDIAHIKTLQKLELNNNQLTDIEDLGWMWQGDLVELDLSGNQINEIDVLHGFPYLEKIVLNDNLLVDIGVFKGLTNVRELILNGNLITDIVGLQGLDSLEKLYLHDNRLLAIDGLLGLLSLEEVTLMRNSDLDISPGSTAWDVITQLINLGVSVKYLEEE